MTKLKLPKFNLDQELTLREKVFFALAIIGLLIFFWNTVLDPLSLRLASRLQEEKNLNGQIEGLKKLIDGTRMQLNIQSKFAHEAEQLDEKTKRMLERKVVDPLSEIHSTVSILSSRNTAKGVRINDVHVGDIVDNKTYSVVPLSIDLSARYGAVQTFFSTLENLDRPFAVRRFNLKRGEDVSGPYVKASIDADLYIIKR